MRPHRLLPLLFLGLLMAGCDSSDPDDGNGNGNGGARCPLQVTDHITEPTVWDCEEVHVQRSLRIEDHLQISSDTEVIMSQNTHIRVLNEGRLTAIGVDEHPITFRGAERRKNYWGGISIQTLSDDNDFYMVEIADTGAPGFQNNRWALAVLGGGVPRGRLRYSRSKILNAGGMGLSLSRGAELLGGANWTFEDVDDVIIRATFDTAHQVQRRNTQQRGTNARPWIRVEYGELRESVTWEGGPFPYRLVETPRIEENGALQVTGGTIEFGQDVRLSSGSGTMQFLGSEANPIVLTGVEQIPGYWGGIAYQTVSEDNRIEKTVIEYGGGNNYQNITAAVYVGGNATLPGYVTIRDTHIRESEDMGVLIKLGGVAVLENVTFENNGGENVVDENP